MLRIFRPTTSIAVLILTAACSPLPPVALQATPGDLEILAGEWTGEYESVALGRQGRLEFKLVSETNEARGAVLMVPRGQVQPYQRDPHENPPAAPDLFSTEMLSIKFIRASHGSIMGMLDRYWDPDRQCYATTVFRGEAGRNTFSGTFRTSFACGQGEASGTWHVAKKSARR
jgi:hypothetical protein